MGMKWMVVLPVLFMVFLIGSATCAEATEPEGVYLVGERIVLEGKLSTEQIDGQTVAVLSLYDPIDIITQAGASKSTGNPYDKLTLLSDIAYSGESVRVTGTLLPSADTALSREWFLANAMVEKSTEAVSVSLSRKKATLRVGSELSLSATVSPSSASQKVKWTSSKPSVATVSSKGKVVAKAKGKTTITAKSTNGKSAACVVTVTMPVSGVKLNKTSTTLSIDKTTTLKATVSPSNATTKAVTWSSSKTSVATVDQNGKVKGVKAGTATITAKTKDGGFTAKCKVTVTVPVKSVSFVQDEVFLKKNEKIKLDIKITPTNATNKKVTWSSKNRKIATVDKKGTIKGVRIGTTTITVKSANGKKSTCKVTVVKKVVPVKSVGLNKKTLSFEVGDITSLIATISPANATNQGVTWSSGNKSVATVDSNGKVSAIKSGTATITAKSWDGLKKASCRVTVKNMSELTFEDVYDSYTFRLKVGQRGKLINSDWGDRPVKWSVKDPTIATVDQNGVITGKSYGFTPIYCEYYQPANEYHDGYEATSEYICIVSNDLLQKQRLTKSDLLIHVEGKTLDLSNTTIAQVQKLFPGGKKNGNKYTYKGLIFYFYTSRYEGKAYSYISTIELSKKAKLSTNRGIGYGDSEMRVMQQYGWYEGNFYYYENAKESEAVLRYNLPFIDESIGMIDMGLKFEFANGKLVRILYDYMGGQ